MNFSGIEVAGYAFGLREVGLLIMLTIVIFFIAGWLRAAALVALIGSVLFLVGCAEGSLSSGAACEIFKPITGKPGKTPKHIAAQIVEHNAAGVGACGWTP